VDSTSFGEEEVNQSGITSNDSMGEEMRVIMREGRTFQEPIYDRMTTI